MVRIETTWNLRRLMAERGMYQTSDLVPLLAEREIFMSREQVYRLVAHPPRRLNFDVIGAICDALECEVHDLITWRRAEQKKVVGLEPTRTGVGDLRPVPAKIRRPEQRNR
ncbi:DNA-binding Xre family transcriptional regulator [Microbacterium marinum]|uniref:DNA-binding Xre family transcriptional regulator n=1 Tax=Microbacterium marinum TaxID=421115 RepID=A0A7W7BSM3_9MICO|nr:helix-turn-helix transcriptional regulator [Microbacterium marinum]MBB4666934.1 DNA-binding Xre family transcriptional regulator [Microbacterium marinum]